MCCWPAFHGSCRFSPLRWVWAVNSPVAVPATCRGSPALSGQSLVTKDKDWLIFNSRFPCYCLRSLNSSATHADGYCACIQLHISIELRIMDWPIVRRSAPMIVHCTRLHVLCNKVLDSQRIIIIKTTHAWPWIQSLKSVDWWYYSPPQYDWFPTTLLPPGAQCGHQPSRLSQVQSFKVSKFQTQTTMVHTKTGMISKRIYFWQLHVLWSIIFQTRFTIFGI